MKTQQQVHAPPRPLTHPQRVEGATGLTVMNHNQAVAPGLRVKSKVKGGGLHVNHHQVVVPGLRVKSKVKAGGVHLNHSQTVVRVE
jgi:hypothetical protein